MTELAEPTNAAAEPQPQLPMGATDDGYLRIPRWVVGLGAGILVMVVALVAVTVPGPWNCPTPPAAAGAVPAIPVPTLAPRTVNSPSRTLGDPRAQFALVEYGDFQ